MNIKGYIGDIIFRNEENNYTIAVFESDFEYITIVGYIAEIHDQQMSIDGDIVEHSKFGEQFLIEKYEYILPEMVDDIYSFLVYNNIDGIGKKTAKRIIELFGEDTLNIMNNDIDRLLEVNGIGLNTLEKIKKSFFAIMNKQEIIMFLNKYGFKGNIVSQIINKYKEEVIDVVEDNPYKLFFDIRGITLKKIDEVALKIGIDIDDKRRIEAIIIDYLRKSLMTGSTFVISESLVNDISYIQHIDRELVENSIISLTSRGYIRMTENKIFLMQTYLCINSISQNVDRILEGNTKFDVKKDIDYIEQLKSIKFSNKQRDAIFETFKNNISIITGGPGTGKTTIVEALCEIANNNSLRIKLAAPTARAAIKMKNSVVDKASTIHRLLEYKYSDEEGMLSFERNEDNYLEVDILIVDEVSMIDIFLFEKLLCALPDDIILVLIGDSNQLPSVGAGRVLLDLINSNCIKTTELDVIFRQKQNSMIPYNANLIISSNIYDIEENSVDYFSMNLSDNIVYDKLETIIKERIPAKYNLDMMRDLQILTPTKKGKFGTVELNKFIQKILNPFGKEYLYGSTLYRVGDKVLMQKNNYNIEWTDINNYEEQKGIFNGEIGFIEDINHELKEVVVLFEEYKRVKIKFLNLDLITHAYALTVHKAQGSEYKGVIFVMSNVSELLANKSIVYTAVTRAKEFFLFIGNKNLYYNAIKNNRVDSRNTYLKEMLNFYSNNK